MFLYGGWRKVVFGGNYSSLHDGEDNGLRGPEQQWSVGIQAWILDRAINFPEHVIINYFTDFNDDDGDSHRSVHHKISSVYYIIELVSRDV